MKKSLNPDIIRDAARGNLLKYTRRAFKAIPEIENPFILDIGCGSGVPTIELSMLCDCRIVALDNDENQLKWLKTKLKKLTLEDTVKIVNSSIHDMNFDTESFDIIWSEGSIFVVGFEKGLKEWKRFLKQGGFMAIHDERGNVDGKLKQIVGCAYELLDYFILDKDVWWNEYYSPLEKEICRLKDNHPDMADISVTFSRELSEIRAYKKDPEKCESVFFILRKK